MKRIILIEKSKLRPTLNYILTRSWSVILTQWSSLTVTTDEVITIKSEETRTKTENSYTNNNFKALNAIFLSC